MQKPIKVVHLSASDKGGAFVVAQNLVDNLQNSGISAKHLVFSGERQTFRLSNISFIDRFLKFSLHAFEKFILFFFEKNSTVRFKFSLGKPGIPYFILKKHLKSADIIHIHWINKGFININDLKYFRKPIIWTCHDIWAVTGGCHLTNGCENYKIGCGYCPMLKSPAHNDISWKSILIKEKIYKSTNLTLVSPSQWMNRNLSESKIGSSLPRLCIKNGIDTAIFKLNNRKENNKFVIGFVAANLNDENKAFHRLIEALNKLNDKHLFKLLLIGNQKETFKFTIPCEFEIISDINSPKAMSEQYNRMDALAITSTLETFPTILMEACCCGVSLIGFNVGGIGEIIIPFNGQLIKPFDTESFANGLTHFKDNKMDKAILSKYSIEKFGQSAMVKSYIELYHNKLNQL